jgi:hypothetical protein
MNLNHAVLWIDHQTAQLLQFDEEHVRASKVKAHQHGSEVRTQHEFFAHVCDALAEVPQLLVVGPRTGLSDFEHYAKKHRPQTAARVAAYQVQDHPTQNQLVALARQYFLKADRMAGIPTPT